MTELFNLEINQSTNTTKKKSNAKKSSIIKDTELKDFLGDDLILNKDENNKSIVDLDDENIDIYKILKQKKISIQERLSIINKHVMEVLGKQKQNVLVIKDRKTFDEYIDNAIKFGRIAIDTETNNSLDPITCDIMGLCLYYSGGKQAYIPVNHVNPDTEERLSWQLTEQDCKEELQKIIDAKTLVVMHNGKFDYEVIKCTCGIEVRPDWDTIIAARLLNENEEASLKSQYISKIDPSQSKYDIEKLFTNVRYAYVDPEIFGLYGSQDAYMTDKLYEYQKPIMDLPEHGPHLDISGKHMVNGLKWVFEKVEMPIVIITAEMELRGVKVDTAYGARLKEKYERQKKVLEEVTIKKPLELIQNAAQKWCLTKTAHLKTIQYQPKKSKLSLQAIEKRYPEVEKETGRRFKYGKPKCDQLTFPINLASPVQLAIIYYDVLQCSAESTKAPRGTGEEELKKLVKQLNTKADKLAARKIISIDSAQEADDLEAELYEEQFAENVENNEEETEEVIGDVTDGITITEELLRAGADLGNAILDRRGIMKLLTTYIDTIPTLTKHWPDGRVRFHLNSLGTDTGRFSSGGKLKFWENDEAVTVSGINIQNIPSKAGEIRQLFIGDTKYHKIESSGDYLDIPETDEVKTQDGWKLAGNLSIGDVIIGDNSTYTINNIIKNDQHYYIYC